MSDTRPYRITRLAWTIAPAIAGSCLMTGARPVLRPELVIEVSSWESLKTNVLQSARLRKFATRQGHGRIRVNCNGTWEVKASDTEEIEAQDWGRHLEICGAVIKCNIPAEKSSTPKDFALFRNLHGVIWNRCRFILSRNVTSDDNSDDAPDITGASARTAVFHSCNGVMLKSCSIEMETAYHKNHKIDKNTFNWPTGEISGVITGGFVYYGGGGGGGGGGGFNDSKEINFGELPWNGVITFALLMCNDLTIFGGSCSLKATCKTNNCDACAVCIGVYACSSASRKSIRIQEGSTALPYGLLSGRIGWRTADGELKRRGMDFTLVANSQASFTPPSDKPNRKGSLNSQAICQGMGNCKNVTPVYTDVVADAKATASGALNGGHSYAAAFGFQGVTADREPRKLSGKANATASHPVKWRTVGGTALESSDNIMAAITGTAQFDLKGGV